MRHLLALTVVVCLLGAVLGGCGAGACGTVVNEAFDVRGASNSACTLTLNKGNNVSFDIPAPSPAVADTSLAPRNPPQQLSQMNDCANGVAVPVAPSFATVLRTSDTLCMQTKDVPALEQALGTNDCTNVTITLTCAGTTLYDRAPIHACSCQG